MARDVIMPALGMAQDTGLLVAWAKKPGDKVAPGDVLFEVETDKSTMEVEAQAAGYLVDVAAGDGEDVPVGQVIARIADSPEGSGTAAAAPGTAAQPDETPAPGPAPAAEGDLPAGREIIMPVLGMAQDSGLLVAWSKTLGDAVAEDDTLFEVETDKSTMEVPAGAAGYLAAILAAEGEDVPTGQVIAILTDAAPETPVRRSLKDGAAAPAPAGSASEPGPAPEPPAASEPAAPAAARPRARADAGAAAPAGRLLASPKLRRHARDEGLDLALLAAAGVPQPWHMRDLDTLRGLAAETEAATGAEAGIAAAGIRLTAALAGDGLAAFAAEIAGETGKTASADPRALLAGFAGASLGLPATVAVETPAGRAVYTVPARRLSQTEAAEDDDAPDLVLRDLRQSRIASVALGPERVPVLTLTKGPDGLTLTLEAAPRALDPATAIALLDGLAGRIEDPMRHLL